jgi:hypothetical protein
MSRRRQDGKEPYVSPLGGIAVSPDRNLLQKHGRKNAGKEERRKVHTRKGG